MPLLDELKEYLRIDGNEEDGSLNLLLSSSLSYLETAGVSKPSTLEDPFEDIDPNAKYKLAVLMLATHWYENRLVVTSSAIKLAQLPIPYGFESLVLQLKAEALPIVSDVYERET